VTNPVTKLDERFSAPDAQAADWAQTEQALAGAELYWLTTVRADGRPHVTPLVAVWLDGTLYFSTGDAEQKAVNLRGNSHAILTTGRSDWDQGTDYVVEGDAVLVTSQDQLNRLAEAWTRKWDGRWQYEVGPDGFRHPGGDERILVFGVSPAKVLAFGKAPFSHTRHVF
jgi:general stress protein 26